jgi:error-prone DNA polymerase
MGFYSPATIVQDAQRHGVKVQPVCVVQSDWRSIVVADDTIRLGFCSVTSFRQEHAEQLVSARAEAPFGSVDDFKRRVQLAKDELRTLAEIGALNALAEHRREAMWRVEEAPPEPLFERAIASTPRANGSAEKREGSPLLPMTLPERVQADFEGMNLTTGPHPMKLLRAQLPNAWRASDMPQARHGSTVQIAGNVICRQRPGTAKGFVFISLEDETGVSNAIVTPDLFEKLRLLITEEPFLIIQGQVQNTDGVTLVKARRISPLASAQITGSASHDFH